MPESQINLLPETPPEGRFAMVSLGHLTWDLEIDAPSELVESVRRLGVIQPIAVVQTAPRVGRYKIVAGRRRVNAAMRANLTEIPAIVYPPGTSPNTVAAMSLTENVQRRPNPLTDLIAIEQLMRTGATEQDVSHQLGLAINTIRARLKLLRLTPAMRQRLMDGTLSAPLAERVATLPTEQQEALHSRTPADDRVTGRDVREVMQVVRTDAAMTLDDALFAPSSNRTAIDAATLMPADEPMTTGRLLYLIDHATPQVQAEVRNVLRMTAPAEDAGTPSWANVVRHLEMAERLMPISPDDDSDRFYVQINELLVIARRQ